MYVGMKTLTRKTTSSSLCVSLTAEGGTSPTAVSLEPSFFALELTDLL